MPSRRRDRGSAAVVLAALMLGSIAAGSATVAAQTRLTPGVALAGDLLAGRSASQAGQPSAEPAPGARPHLATPVAPSTQALPTTTEPPPPPPPPPTTPPPPPPPPASPTASPTAAVSQAERVVQLVNAERAAAGCDPLRIDERLVAAAQAHSTDMAVNDYFSHTSLDGRTFADRILDAGYAKPAAENIAMGQRSADQVVRAWMTSRGHRANILNCEYTAIGVGLDTRGWYWTQDFGYPLAG